MAKWPLVPMTASALLLAACGSSTPTASQPTFTAQNTVITASDISDAVTLDPNVAYEFSSTAAAHQIYSTLVQFPPGNLTQPVPSVATSWSVSSNGQDWTFQLRKGVKFSNGDTLTAQDVVYSLERVVNIPTDPASWLITQMGFTPANVAQDVRAVGSNELKITLPQPFAQGAFLAVLANPVASIVDSRVVKAHVKNGDWGTHWLYNHSAGSGPYELTSWQPSQQMEFTANPNYTLGPAPAVKRIYWKQEADTTARMDMLLRGDADIAIGLTASQVQSLQGKPGISILKVPSIAEVYVGMGVKTVPALGNPYVREAMKYAIDYNSIIKNLLNGNGTLLQGIIPKGIFGYTDKAPFTYNLQKAKQLLAQGGYPNGFSATMLVSSGTAAGGVSSAALAEALTSGWAKVGINVSVRQLQSSELYSEYRAHKAQLVLAEWALDYPDPQDFGAPFADYTQKSLIWRLQDNNTALSALVQQSAGMQDTPQRQALYNQINADLVTGPFAIIYQPDEVIAYSSKLHNLTYDDLNGIDYAQLTK